MPLTRAEYIMNNEEQHARHTCDQRYQQGSAFVRGEYCGIHEVTVPLLDPGFRFGDAVYDVVTVSKDYFFRLDDHMARFQQSCEKIRLTNPYSPEQTRHILAELVCLAGLRDAYVFWCVTRGRLKDQGSQRIEGNNPDVYSNSFYAFVIPYVFIAGDKLREQGLELLISKNHIRIPSKAVDPRAKNFHWLDMTLSLFEAGDTGKNFSLLVDSEGYITESPGANILMFVDNILSTPSNNCLEGITRQTALELAEGLGVPTQIRPIHYSELLEADEVFLSSSAGGIMPVKSVDDRIYDSINKGKSITETIHNSYWKKRWDGWRGINISDIV